MRSPLIVMVAVLLAAASLLPAHSASAQEIPPDAPAPAIPPIPWQLTAFPGVSTGIEPGRYTVHFLPDETVNIRADCNWVAGFWSGANGAGRHGDDDHRRGVSVRVAEGAVRPGTGRGHVLCLYRRHDPHHHRPGGRDALHASHASHGLGDDAGPSARFA